LSDPNTIEKNDTERPMKSSNRIGKRVRALCDCGSDPRASKLQQQSATRAWKDERNCKGTRVAWAGDFKGYTPYEPEAISVCKNALRVFESVGCVVKEAAPDYPLEAVWNAVLRLRSWQQGGALLAYYNDPSKRAMLKPEAIFEIEMGLKLSAYDVTAASVVRSEWHQAVRRFFDQYDYLIAPTAQLFPFDVDLRWPQEIAGKKMTTYHEWMKAMLLITMSGCPALAVPAGFGNQGLPTGIQIVAPNHHEFACLQLAYAYELA
jgi:amidase